MTEITVWVVGVTATLTLIVKYLWPATVELVRIYRSKGVLLDIADEFRPNDGRSLVDRIARIELAQCEMQRSLETIVSFMSDDT